MENVLEEIKRFVTKPVSNLMEKEQNEEIKVSGIKTLVSAAVIALVSIFAFMAGVEMSLKAYTSSPEALATAKNAVYQQVNLFGLFFQVFAIAVGVIAGVALVLFAVAKLMKVEKSFKNSLALAANYAIYGAVAILVYYLLQFINQQVATGVALFITAFSSYAVKYAFKNSLGEVDDDKLTIFASVVVTVVAIVGFLIIYNVVLGSLTSMMMGSYSSSYNSLNSLYSMY